MGRDEVLQVYRPLRAGIQRVLKQAPQACTASDMKRVLSELAPWAGEAQLQGEVLDMMMDLILFEPDKCGRRGIDRFQKTQARHLSAEEQSLLSRMTGAWFSLFRVAERHDAAGCWLEDLLRGDQRIWLMDEGLEMSAAPGLVVGLRLFDAGPYHAAFGIVTQPDDEALGACLAAHARRQPLQIASSAAVLCYAEKLASSVPVDEDEWEMMEAVAGLLGAVPPLSTENDGRSRSARLPRAGRRRRT